MSLTEFAVSLIKERNHSKYDSPWAADNINTYRMCGTLTITSLWTKIRTNAHRVPHLCSV